MTKLTSIYTYSHMPNEVKKAFIILKKYLNTKDIIACQEELIEAGLKDYAKL
jgi:hypothetical protein